MTDFRLDSLTGDLIVEGGMQLTVDDGEDAAQRLSLAIGLNLGEWFANINDGFPWIRNNNEDFPESLQFVLGNKLANNPQFLSRTLTDFIQSQDFVRSVTSSYTFDNRTRVFNYTANVIAQSGVAIEITPLNLQL